MAWLFVAGLIVGAAYGVLTMSLVIAASRADDRLEMERE